MIKIGEEILQAQGDSKPLSHHWPSLYLHCHQDLRSCYIPPLDKDCVFAEDEGQIHHYFKLFKATKMKYNIEDNDIYNMDEKGVMMGVLSKLKVVVS